MNVNRDDWVVRDGDTPPADIQPAPPFDGFEEPQHKAGDDVTQRCAPEGIDPGDERYIGKAVEVDFETGAVTIIDPDPLAQRDE